MMRRSSKFIFRPGFSLIELMVVLAIIGILAAIAVPAYANYVLRSRLVEAFTGLASVQTAAEDYWNSHHTYVGLDTDTPRRLPPNGNFAFTLGGATESAYTVTATGSGPAAGFTYTIDQAGTRTTAAAPSDWGTSAGCWIADKGGRCLQ